MAGSAVNLESVPSAELAQLKEDLLTKSEEAMTAYLGVKGYDKLRELAVSLDNDAFTVLQSKLLGLGKHRIVDAMVNERDRAVSSQKKA